MILLTDSLPAFATVIPMVGTALVPFPIAVYLYGIIRQITFNGIGAGYIRNTDHLSAR